MHQEKHLTSVRSDLGIEKTYCTECGRFIEHKPYVPNLDHSHIPASVAKALKESNAQYMRALKDTREDEMAFRVFAFVIASLVILGIMSRVIQ